MKKKTHWVRLLLLYCCVLNKDRFPFYHKPFHYVYRFWMVNENTKNKKTKSSPWLIHIYLLKVGSTKANKLFENNLNIKQIFTRSMYLVQNMCIRTSSNESEYICSLFTIVMDCNLYFNNYHTVYKSNVKNNIVKRNVFHVQNSVLWFFRFAYTHCATKNFNGKTMDKSQYWELMYLHITCIYIHIYYTRTHKY